MGCAALFTTLKASLELEIVARRIIIESAAGFEYMVFAKDGKFESRDEQLGIGDWE